MSKKSRTWKLAVSGALALTVIAAGIFTYRYESASYKEQMDELEKQQTAEAEETEEKNEPKEVPEEEPETADVSTDSVDAVTQEDETQVQQETENTQLQQPEEEAADTAVRSILPELNFSEETVLQAPVNGQVLIDYSMDSTVYFPTLNVYKYNPAVILSAEEGEQVLAAANGKVTSIAQNDETGRTVTMDLGNGYEAVYGQLQEVNVTEGAYVYEGASIGTVGTPTRYYSQEGTNLYFQMKKDGQSIDPMLYLNGAEE